MFGKIGKMVSNAADAIGNALDRVNNEEELDAVVAATVLVAAADGHIDEVEKEAAFKAVANHESLKAFDQKRIRQKFDSDANLINADRTLAQEVLYDKVSVITDKIARIRVLGIVSEIAAADGVVTKDEQAVIDKIRKTTGKGG